MGYACSHPTIYVEKHIIYKLNEMTKDQILLRSRVIPNFPFYPVYKLSPGCPVPRMKEPSPLLALLADDRLELCG